MDRESEQRFERIEDNLALASETLVTLAQSLARFAETSNARMTRMEENLELLIRAITAEHKNGKSSA